MANRGKGVQEGKQSAGAFTARGSSLGIVRFDQQALAALLQGTNGPVAKDLTRKALRVQGAAKRLCPVDTGRLRASIAWRMERDWRGLCAIVGTNVSYAAPIEFGTRRMRAQPFLRPALREAIR